jgi:hypothetical protein
VQGLVHLGVLEYSEALLKRLREDPHLPSGDRLEVEIRTASIWGVEVRCNTYPLFLATLCY